MSDEIVESFPRARSQWITESRGWPAVTISTQLGLVVASGFYGYFKDKNATQRDRYFFALVATVTAILPLPLGC
jgi:hypothetical protein